ncbi:MAG: hypothetical protein C4551_05935 [Bacillota bacterium]|nr:MAG: hypothetical protein C4551_05935 [Bacillota bacterium]
MGTISPASIVTRIGWSGAVAALVITGLELAILWALTHPTFRDAEGRPFDKGGRGRLLAGIALAALTGLAAFPLSIALVQVPLQAAVTRWAMLNLATTSPYVLYAPAVLVSGLVQEPAKLVAALTGRRAAAARPDGPALLVFGAAAGAAFGGIEAAWILSEAIATAGSPGHVLQAGVASSTLALIAPAAVERVFAVLFHISSAALAAYGWGLGPVKGLAALGAMALVHAAVNYGAVAAAAGDLGVIAVEAYVAGWALALAGAVVVLARHARPKGERSRVS